MNAAGIRKLSELGLSAEQIADVAEALETDSLESADKRRARNQRYYAKRLKASENRLNQYVLEPSESVLKRLNSDASRVRDKPLRLVTSGKTCSKAKAFSLSSSFDEFWLAYPNKVGKRDAEKKFRLAIERIDEPDPLAIMLAAVESAKRSDRWKGGFVPNPATWLNQDRWLDETEPGNGFDRSRHEPLQLDGDPIERRARIRKGLGLDGPSTEVAAHRPDGHLAGSG